MSASGESSTTIHRLLHASGSHPISPPNDPKTNQYNQDLGLIHSTNGNHLESPNEGSSIDHQVTIYLHAQNITMFPTNETWIRALALIPLLGKTVADPDPVSRRRSGSAWLQPESQGDWLFTVGGGILRLIKSTTGSKVPSSACTRRPDEIITDGNSSKNWPEQIPARGGGGGDMRERRGRRFGELGLGVVCGVLSPNHLY
ncbi:von Willebrand factor, type A domain containing protein [Dorcoceras hygrometricum]|uniref:von Willebrand factor, type A domain containing protein n=1 Tax=Dorcoceras hygrometricum TaxID=472368 RepID=A0A2Z7BPD6_9LAMI|nr:von Willebrand factor, type A domain containing protein [Dorcoceras hygrometricum]